MGFTDPSFSSPCNRSGQPFSCYGHEPQDGQSELSLFFMKVPKFSKAWAKHHWGHSGFCRLCIHNLKENSSIYLACPLKVQEGFILEIFTQESLLLDINSIEQEFHKLNVNNGLCYMWKISKYSKQDEIFQ